MSLIKAAVMQDTAKRNGNIDVEALSSLFKGLLADDFKCFMVGKIEQMKEFKGIVASNPNAKSLLIEACAPHISNWVLCAECYGIKRKAP